MTVTRKPAGEARERPRSPHRTDPHPHGHGPDVMRKGVGAAPAFDAATRRIAPADEAPRGMISNPWVRFWTGAGPSPIAQPAVSHAPVAHAQKKGAGEGRRASGKGGKEGPRKKSSGRRRKERDAES
jgi:hypothetical protein